MRLFLFVFMGLLATVVQAHDTGDARGTLRVAADGTVDLELKMARADVAELLGLADDAPDGALDPRLGEVSGRLASWLTLVGEPTPCLWQDVQVAPAGVRGLAITARAACPVAAELVLTWPAASLTRLAVSLTAAVTPPNQATQWVVLDRQNPSAIVPLRAEASPGGGQFLLLGFQHMLTGWDHLAFLLALLLACARLKPLLLITTSFTVAHSITLGLGVTGVVAVDPAVVEPIIAASIAIAAAAALVRWAQGRLAWPGSGRPSPSVALQVGLCFAFGLVHGLGFAGLLAELAPTLDAVLVPLLTFNLGVELGQVAAVAAAFPLLWAVGRSAAGRPVVGALLVGLVGLGAVVAVQRLMG